MIEFQYFEGCPNADRTHENLVEVIKELNLPKSDFQVQEIPDLEAARIRNFQGSPNDQATPDSGYIRPGRKPGKSNP